MHRFLLALSLAFAALALHAKAVPVISYDDKDDTEVVELPSNAILPAPSRDIIDLSHYGEKLFGKPDKKVTAALVANYTASDTPNDVNPEELGTYLEGDILVPDQALITKNGLTTVSSRWPKGVVPYDIRGSFNARDMQIIRGAMAEYHKRTCIRFVPRSTERDYISIVSDASGCWSSVGRVGGKQEVNLQSPGCLTKPGTAMHELMHALGFLHEQNRMERDGYVAIQYRNIQSSAMSNFDKAARTEAFGVPYDYGSVMHYSAKAFSINGQPTIVAMQTAAGARMGQREGFSDLDVEKLNKMYDCGYVGSTIPTAGTSVEGAPTGTGTGNGNPIIDSFLGGLISGLGFGDSMQKAGPKTFVP